MKKNFLLVVFCLFCFISLYGQKTNDELYYFIKTWGLLKYYHPAIQKGSIDWDQVFINNVNTVLQGKNPATFSTIENLINVSGKNGIRLSSAKLFEQYRHTPYANLDFGWILDKDFIVSTESRKWLNDVIENYQPGPNVYIKKEINKFYFNTPLEKFWYPSSYMPDSAHSLLVLARFWNIINYFNPHKKLFDQNWDTTLKKYIPLVLKNAGKKQVYLNFGALAAAIDDSHAFYTNYEFDSLTGLHTPALLTALYENKYNVVVYISEEIQKITGIAKGDIITKLNNRDLAPIRDELKEYCKGSTDGITQRSIDGLLFKGNYNSSYDLEFINANNQTRKASFIFTKELTFKYTPASAEDRVKEFPQKAIYVKLPVSKNQLESAFDKAQESGNYLILDLRSGAANANWNWILGKLIRSRVHVAKYFKCSFTYPGYFEPEDVYKSPLSAFFSKAYTGKLIVLVNERVLSSVEFNLMIMKAAVPNMTIIGRNTGGADGAATSILMQDNILTYFTRDVVLFPDGIQTQRIGIIPDIYVNDSIELFRQGKDAILEKALEFVTQQQMLQGTSSDR